MGTDSRGRLLHRHGADLGYRWLPACLETLSSSGQWHLQSPPPVGRALWCSVPAKRTDRDVEEKSIRDAARLHVGSDCGKHLTQNGLRSDLGGVALFHHTNTNVFCRMALCRRLHKCVCVCVWMKLYTKLQIIRLDYMCKLWYFPI